MTHTSIIDTPLGPVRASAEQDALTGLWFVGQKYYPSGTDAWADAPDAPVFNTLREWLADYFSGGRHAPLPALAPKGTAFQKAVWDILLQIPYGRVTTYGEIAKQLAAARRLPSMSAQAVGGAVGHNPISILIPCHRVVGADGSLTGYAGGLEKKTALLQLERGPTCR
ncbi:methylated-DNA-[protein]-cysteine S-methyltransferase [Sporobacter termitidis DSM 10068]|uniref:Methylated-DNA--protein-cysteine methyltransferase n=1 Tax=Sporobacter termitidis DSM 10068 TaxID=1123282 RepID=A0A1M5UT17_9FIRM|nr:methylated-DNA--[protein]-cysteine S-methyltransferase [Sporobacter termitidis]SHH66084.1 methylated-DNA-[protein]-cysteine S-methyltransferase [Sporobacter termitidis DSM 10068]